MNMTYIVTDSLIVKFSGDAEFDVPINPTTKQKFQTLEEANMWAATVVIKMEADVYSASSTKTWTPYSFMKLLPDDVKTGIVSLELSGDIETIKAMRLFMAAQNIRSDDENLIKALNYWKFKEIITQEQIDAILG